MMIAPKASTNDGLVEYVRWGTIGRLGLIRELPGLYDGTHIQHPLAECQSISHVEFDLDHRSMSWWMEKSSRLHCEELDVLPPALERGCLIA